SKKQIFIINIILKMIKSTQAAFNHLFSKIICKRPNIFFGSLTKYTKVIDLIYNFSIYLIHYFLPLQKLFFGRML
ncbi:hypothetical protein CEJ79_10785, partial [Acinetobacter baumannii]